jgi:toluene monooxygenase electron transfer component
VPSNIEIAPQAAPQHRDGVIREVRRLTKDVAHFDVQLSAPMRFEAGQFVVLETPDLTGGRAYSMVNFDADTDRIALVLKRKPGGGFSEWLFAEPQNEPEVRVFGPLGRAVFRPAEGKNIVCVAGGSGIAGMMSILEHAVRADYFREHKGFVFFGVRTLADTFYLERLSRYAEAAHGNLEVTVALSDEAAATPTHGEFPALKLSSGMVHDVAAAAMQGRYGDAIVYVAGPPIMVDSAIRSLIVGGVSTQDIRYDKFG